MHREIRVGLGLVICALAAGCRTAMHVAEVPRTDLHMEGSGNRGYLVGTPPPASALKTTRQMIQTDVEIPTRYKPKAGQKPVSLDNGAPSGAIPAAPAIERYDTYVVQKGDTLWSIAAKPEMYGKATHWRRLFDANRDLLKSPDRLKGGMTLQIPRGDTDAVTFTNEGISSGK